MLRCGRKLDWYNRITGESAQIYRIHLTMMQQLASVKAIILFLPLIGIEISHSSVDIIVQNGINFNRQPVTAVSTNIQKDLKKFVK